MKRCPRCATGWPDPFTFCPREGARLEAAAPEGPGVAGYDLGRRLEGDAESDVFEAAEVKTGALRHVRVFSAPAAEQAIAVAQPFTKIRHPLLVPLLGAHATLGKLALISEPVSGTSLARLLERGPLSVADAVAVLRAVAQCLAAIHAAGALHGDVTPGSVEIVDAPDGAEARLKHIGLLRIRQALAHDYASNADADAPGIPIMAPEVLTRGLQAIGERTELYQLGTLAYQLVTGREAFRGDNPVAVMKQHLNTLPPPPQEVRPGLEPRLSGLVMSLLKKDPARRIARASLVAHELEAIEASLTTPPSRFRRLPPLDATWHPGGLVAGRWRITGVGSADDLGLRFRATDQETQEPVEVRVVRPLVGQERTLARLPAAAEPLLHFRHPAMAQVLAVAATEDGQIYAVSEHVEGPLANELTMPVPDALLRRVAVATLSLLQAAHSAGLAHLSLSPAQIVLGNERVAVKELGLRALLLRLLREDGDDASFGAPHFRAPEQAAGIAVDARADLHSFGRVLEGLLLGVRPAGPLGSAIAGLTRVDPAQRLSPAAAIDSLLEPALLPEDLSAPARHALARARRIGLSDAAALAEYEAALRSEPQNAALHLQRGRILERMQRTSDAITAYRQAAQLDPGDGAAQHLLAEAEDADPLQAEQARARWEDLARFEARTLANGHQGAVIATAFSADGRWLVSGGADGIVGVWPGRQAPMRPLGSHEGGVKALAFVGDERIVSAGVDGLARVIDVDSGSTIAVLAGHTGMVTSVAASPDGRFALTGGEDKTARIWDIALGSELGRVDVSSRVSAVAWSADGKRCVIAGRDVRVIDAASRRLERTLIGHLKPVTRVTFAEGGRLIATAAMDRSVRLWDAETGKEADVPLIHPAHPVSLSACGAWGLWTAALDGSLRLYDLPTGTLRCVQQAKGSFPLGLSCTENIVACGGDVGLVEVWESQPNA